MTGNSTAANGTVRAFVAPAALGIIMVAVWQAIVVGLHVKPFLVPSPLGIAGQFIDSFPAILRACTATGRNALVGLLIGAVFGIIVALISNALRIVDWMLVPVVAALAVIPIVALAPVFYAMFGAAAETGRQWVAAVAVFVPMYLNTLNGLRQAKPVHRDLMRSYAASRAHNTRLLLIPGAIPYVLNGLKIGSSLAVISALIAEYFGGPAKGLGIRITSSAAGSNYTTAWAYVLGAVLLGTVFYGITALVENYSLRHRGGL